MRDYDYHGLHFNDVEPLVVSLDWDREVRQQDSNRAGSEVPSQRVRLSTLWNRQCKCRISWVSALRNRDGELRPSMSGRWLNCPKRPISLLCVKKRAHRSAVEPLFQGHPTRGARESWNPSSSGAPRSGRTYEAVFATLLACRPGPNGSKNAGAPFAPCPTRQPEASQLPATAEHFFSIY